MLKDDPPKPGFTLVRRRRVVTATTVPYGGFGYPYGGFYGSGFYGGGFRYYRHYGRRYYGWGYDLFDPFVFGGTQIVRYPYKTISFQNGRVVAYQFLMPPVVY